MKTVLLVEVDDEPELPGDERHDEVSERELCTEPRHDVVRELACSARHHVRTHVATHLCIKRKQYIIHTLA